LEIGLDDVRIAGTGEPEPQRDARHMPVDRDGWHPEGAAEDDRRRLPADSPEGNELVHRPRDHTAESLDKAETGTLHRLRFHPEEAGRPKLAFEDAVGDPQPGRCAPVLHEERLRHFVHTLVAGLRGEDRRDEELERRREVESRTPVRIGLREPADDRARAQTLRGRRRLR